MFLPGFMKHIVEANIPGSHAQHKLAQRTLRLEMFLYCNWLVTFEMDLTIRDISGLDMT
jgi:hypothetical protein